MYLYLYGCVVYRCCCIQMYMWMDIYSMYVCTCRYICMYRVCARVRVYNCIRVSLCVWMCVAAFRTRSCGPNSVTGNSNWRPLWTRFTGDSKLIYEMIRRSVPVRAVKTWWQFDSKMASFHVSVCSYVISLFTVVSMRLHVTLIISCERLTYFTYMITCITSWDINN